MTQTRDEKGLGRDVHAKNGDKSGEIRGPRTLRASIMPQAPVHGTEIQQPVYQALCTGTTFCLVEKSQVRGPRHSPLTKPLEAEEPPDTNPRIYKNT